MTKKQIKKAGYKRIIKEGQSHQEVYEDLKTTKPAFNEIIAEILAKIPSKKSIIANKNWRNIYLILIILFIVIRLLSSFVLANVMSLNPIIVLFLLLFSVLVPAVGIYAILTHRMESLRGVSFVLIYSLFRSYKNIHFVLEDLIWFIPVAGVIILGFVLPNLMKTKFTKTIVKSDINGKMMTDFDIVFDVKEISTNEDLLDSDL